MGRRNKGHARDHNEEGVSRIVRATPRLLYLVQPNVEKCLMVALDDPSLQTRCCRSLLFTTVKPSALMYVLSGLFPSQNEVC